MRPATQRPSKSPVPSHSKGAAGLSHQQNPDPTLLRLAPLPEQLTGQSALSAGLASAVVIILIANPPFSPQSASRASGFLAKHALPPDLSTRQRFCFPH